MHGHNGKIIPSTVGISLAAALTAYALTHYSIMEPAILLPTVGAIGLAALAVLVNTFVLRVYDIRKLQLDKEKSVSGAIKNTLSNMFPCSGIARKLGSKKNSIIAFVLIYILWLQQR